MLFFQKFSYRFWRRWLVKKVVIFVSQIVATDTIRASYTVIAQLAISTVGQLVRIPAGIAFSREAEPVAMLTFIDTFTINAILGIIPNLAIEAVFIEESVETQITIFYICTVIRVF